MIIKKQHKGREGKKLDQKKLKILSIQHKNKIQWFWNIFSDFGKRNKNRLYSENP
jgi:hypothetical protein